MSNSADIAAAQILWDKITKDLFQSRSQSGSIKLTAAERVQLDAYIEDMKSRGACAPGVTLETALGVTVEISQ